MASNWTASTSGGYASWFTQDYISSVTQDVTCTYQLVDWQTDNRTWTWFVPVDGSVNTWYPYDATIVALSSVTQDLSETYSIKLAVVSTAPNVTYQVFSSLGTISGSPSLPFASASSDLNASYNVYYAVQPQADLVQTYRVVTYVEELASVYYRVLGSATKDLIPQYQTGGTVTADRGLAYNVITSAQRDVVPTYSVKNSAEQQVSATYNLLTSPLSAGDNRTFTFQVINAVSQDNSFVYKVFNGITKDQSIVYNIRLGAEKDLSPTYSLIAGISQDRIFEYQLAGGNKVTKDQSITYNVVALSTQVPNVIGYPLLKAKKVLEQNNLVLGQVTYN